ncbi:uncharacterized protein [Haliotis asinina]|uniref:uncharacterized protein n=1 Tax=Haliotis asinina TaxID=109174 RepID=UPI0035326E41
MNRFMEAFVLCVIICGIFLLERSQLTTAECQEPDPVPDAYRDLQEDRVTYECMDGFRHFGESTHECKSGKWVGAPTECIIDCGVPSEGLGAVVMYNDTLKGSVASYTCKTNFTSRDSENAARTCSRDGRWSGSPLKCIGTEDIARGKTASVDGMTDGNRQTCAIFRSTTSSLTVTLSSDSNIYYNVHEVELDLKIYTTLVSNEELKVYVQGPSSNVLCRRLGVYDSGVYKFTCATEGVGGSNMKIDIAPRTGTYRTEVCEIQVYGSRYTGECERPPVVVGAWVSFTSTHWNSSAEYSCVPPYYYAGGNNVITCDFAGDWTTPSILCKEMENLSLVGPFNLTDHDRSTCFDVDDVTLTLTSRSEVQWIVVYMNSDEISSVSVSLTIINSEKTKTCSSSSLSASMEGYVMTAFTCHGYPFADSVRVIVKLESSKPVCEIEVYGRSASEGALQCKQQYHGYDYKGDLNFTFSGKPCIDWPEGRYSISAFPDYSFEEIGNKCRATSKSANGPFCYTSSTRIEYCPVPLCDSVCRQRDGRTYSGSIGKANGTSCGDWNSVAPDEFVFTGIASQSVSSFCRNPLGSMSTPWCYNKTGAASLCSIPTCPTTVAVTTSLPDKSSPQAKATCFCWYNYPGSLFTYTNGAVSDTFDRCSRWGFAIMMCYTEGASWTYYSIGTYVSGSSVSETTRPQDTPLISTEVHFTPAVTLTSSTPSVSLTTSTPAVSLTSSLLEVTMTSRNPGSVTPLNTSLDQSSSVSSNYSQSKAAYNSSTLFSSSDQSSFVLSDSSSSNNLSSLSSNTNVELNISSTQSLFSPSSVVAMSNSTTTATMGTTEVPTTTSTPITTSALKQNCQCRCKRNLSSAAISEVIDERKANLTVDPRETTAFLRKKTSAKDKRPAATVSGTTCVAVVSVMFSCIFIPDIINVLSFFTKFTKK